MDIIRRDIHDERFIKLLKTMLEAGYQEAWKVKPNFSGTPQGGIVSPLLANIFLNELDQFVHKVLLPRYNLGKRKENPEYNRIKQRMYRGYISRKEGIRSLRSTTRYNMQDPDFKRLKYVRYADDFILGFIGTKQDALSIKQSLACFLSL